MLTEEEKKALVELKEKEAKELEEKEGKEAVLSMEELGKSISELVGKELDARLEKFERKEIEQPADKPESVKDLKGVDKAVKFIQAIATGNVANIKALSEGTDADGGYLVPNEFRAIVIEKLSKLSVIRPNAQIIPMSREKMDIPVEGAAVTAYWVAENTGLTESNPDWDNLTLNVNKLTGLAKTSRELLADATIDIVNYVAAQFAKAFAKEEDAAFMGGAGTTEPKGLRTYTFAQTLAQAGATLDGDDLIALKYLLPVQYRKNAVWILHNDIIAKVRKLKDSSGRYLWTDGLDTAPDTILGRPVLEQNDIPINLGAGTDESEVYFGDLNYYLIGDRQTMAVETSTEAGDAFEKHQMHIKVIERIDGQLSLTEAFAQLTAVK